MTPEQKLKWAILSIVARGAKTPPPSLDAGNVDSEYDQLVANDGHWDAMNELRGTGMASGLTRSVPNMLTRHYDYHEVAAEMPDGSWVGWTYWHGGGKFGEPGAISWMADAYEVRHREEPKTIMVHLFEVDDTVSATAN